jgi:hypothetical protein
VVPIVSRFFGITIAIFFAAHGFPHFHARHADGEAKVRIDTLRVMDGDLGRRQLRFVLAWAELHQSKLEENWRRARAGETFARVETDAETGTVVWPSGADLAPDTLYERVRSGTWPGAHAAA